MISRRVWLDLEIFGGPYDGSVGLMLAALADADDEVDVPEEILLGRCPGDGRCVRGRALATPGHVTYWTPEEDHPSGVVVYWLDRESVHVSWLGGAARYVHAGTPTREMQAAGAYAGSVA